MLFQKKQKKALFGGSIPPDCAYCQHNRGKPGQVLCALRMAMENGVCKQYRYDPLLREPRQGPTLHTGQYSEKDFEL